MDDVDPADRPDPDALARHHRRMVLAGLPAGAGVGILVWGPGVRRARRAHDRWALAAFGLALCSYTLTAVSSYRRADRAGAEGLARDQRHRDRVALAAEQRARGETPEIELFPPGSLDPGTLPALGVYAAGLVVAAVQYRWRPDRRRRVLGPRWRWRPGPAWWTAWSWQQLPVDGASTAPRAAQIAYQRRQLLIGQATGTLGWVIPLGARIRHPPEQGHEPLRLGADVLRLVSTLVLAAVRYARVPDTVDARRARRAQHDAAVAALLRARATGTPAPPNPWRGEILVAALASASIAAGVAMQVRLHRRRPPGTPPTGARAGR